MLEKLSTTIYLEIDMEPPLELDTSPSSSSPDGQNHNRNHIHIDDYFNSMGS